MLYLYLAIIYIMILKTHLKANLDQDTSIDLGLVNIILSLTSIYQSKASLQTTY